MIATHAPEAKNLLDSLGIKMPTTIQEMKVRVVTRHKMMKNQT